jgi:hypothetical protein
VSVHGHYDRVTVYARIEDAPNVEERLAASMERDDRAVCVLAAQRCGGTLLFYAPATALTLWILHSIWSIGWLVSGLVALALFALALQAAIALTLHLVALPRRAFRVPRGLGWQLLTTLVTGADLVITGGCLLLVGRAAEWWGFGG